MQRFVARQPIFDLNHNVFAYELLFRSGLDNYFSHEDGDKATSGVIANSFLLFGIDNMTGGAKAFINFTKDLIVKDYALVLPRDVVVVEILEDVEPDKTVIDACSRLKKQGYMIALDDFVYDSKYEPLLEIADIVKVDFMISGPDERKAMADKFIPMGIKMLAEKVETKEEFDQAADMGYSYFQGYFFSKPVVVSQKDMPGYKLSLLRLLKEANVPELDFEKMADLIRTEVSLSYKLLRMVNSAAFGARNKIDSLKQALGFLGENGTRKWISLLSLAGIADDKPNELVVTSLVRAKFCEDLADELKMPDRRSELFLMGLFSQLEAISGIPISQALAEIPLKEDVRLALLENKGRLAVVLAITKVYERGDWNRLPSLAAKADIREDMLADVYIEAVQWPVNVLFNG